MRLGANLGGIGSVRVAGQSYLSIPNEEGRSHFTVVKNPQEIRPQLVACDRTVSTLPYRAVARITTAEAAKTFSVEHLTRVTKHNQIIFV
jgi:hypothetical protein